MSPVLPSGWSFLPLGSCGAWLGGGTPSKSNKKFWTNGIIPWLSPKDMGPSVIVETQDRITDEAVKSSSTSLVAPNSVAVVVRSGILERRLPVALVPFVTTLNQDMKALEVRGDLLPKWVLYALQAFNNEILSDCRKAGTTVASIEFPRLRDFEIPVAPLSEQKEIVRILEEQFSRLNAAAATIAAVRRKADQFRRSLLHHKVGHLTSDYLQLDECASMTLGLMLDKGKESGEFQTRYLGNINVRWGSFDISSLKMMDVRPEQMERSTVKAGDIVVCEGGEPGRCAIWLEPTPIAIQKALHRVRPREGFLAEYLALILESEFRGQSQHSLFTGTTIKHLPKEKLRLVKIPNVPISEQRSVVSAFEAVDSSISHAVAHFDRVETGISAARRSLLQAAFTGELTKEWREKNNG